MKKICSVLMSVIILLGCLPLNVFTVSAKDDSGIKRYSVLMLDISGKHEFYSNSSLIYTADSAIDQVKSSAFSFLSAITNSKAENYVAVVAFSTDAVIVSPFTDDINSITEKIGALKEGGENTSVEKGLTAVNGLLEGVDESAVKNVIIVTTGLANCEKYSYEGYYSTSTVGSTWENMSTKIKLYAYANTAIEIDRITKSMSTVYVLGVFHTTENMPEAGKPVVQFFKKFSADLASSPNTFYSVDDPKRIEFAFGEIADDINAEKGIFKYAGQIESGKDSTAEYWYTDSYFRGPGSKYDPSLATMSLCFELSSWSSHEKKKWYDSSVKQSEDSFWEDKLCNAKTLLLGSPGKEEGYEGLGFTDFKANDYWSDTPTMDSIGVCAARKELSFYSGEKYTLVAVAVRGGGYGSEWASNFTLGESGDHKGFAKAKNDTLDFIDSYLRSISSDASKNLKIWITGFSRAGATANMTAAELDNGHSLPNGFTLDPEDIYCYTFEAPQGTVNAAKDSKYSNIHNVYNMNDIVPMVAPRLWDFKRYNYKNDILLPSQYTSSNYGNELNKMFEQLVEMGYQSFAENDYNIKDRWYTQTEEFCGYFSEKTYEQLKNEKTDSDIRYDKENDKFIYEYTDDNGTLTISEIQFTRLAVPLRRDDLNNSFYDFKYADPNSYTYEYAVSKLTTTYYTTNYLYDFTLGYAVNNIFESRSKYSSDLENSIREILDLLMPYSGVQEEGKKSVSDNDLADALFTKKRIAWYLAPIIASQATPVIGSKSLGIQHAADRFVNTLIKELKNRGCNIDKKFEKTLKKLINSIFTKISWDILTNPESVDLIATAIQSLVSSHFQAHYPEVCLAWCRSLDPNYAASIEEKYSTSTRIVKINCPVNIYVYNENEELVLSMEKGNIDSSSAQLAGYLNENGEKTIYLPSDGKYSIKINAFDKGNVNCSLSEYNYNLGEYTRLVNYYDIPVNENDVITADIPAFSYEELVTKDDDGSDSEYIFSLNDNLLYPQDDIRGEYINSEFYNVGLETQGNGGTVKGAGEFLKGSFASVTASAYPEGEFLGWYDDDGTLLSDKENFRFAVQENVNLSAKFTDIEYYHVKFKSEEGGNVFNENGDYPAGVPLKLCAEPEEGYIFDGWTTSGGGVLINASIKDTDFITSDSDVTLTAHFRKENSYRNLLIILLCCIPGLLIIIIIIIIVMIRKRKKRKTP